MLSEWIAINVGDVVANLSIGPGELELCHLTARAGGHFDGYTSALFAVGLRIARRGKRLHLGVIIVLDRGKVDCSTAVVDNTSRTEGEAYWCYCEKGDEDGTRLMHGSLVMGIFGY